mgnify:FL=1
MYVRRVPALSTEIEDLRKELDELRKLVLEIAIRLPQSQTDDSNDD